MKNELPKSEIASDHLIALKALHYRLYREMSVAQATSAMATENLATLKDGDVPDGVIKIAGNLDDIAGFHAEEMNEILSLLGDAIDSFELNVVDDGVAFIEDGSTPAPVPVS